MPKYPAYLHTRTWATKRLAALKRAGWKCQSCGADHYLGARLEVHHKSYKRLGRERATDLAVLCRQCHAKLHKVKP